MNYGKFIKKFIIESGVSLIELVVAVTIFSVLILSATGIFKMVVDGQRNAVSAQNVQENMRYALEKISKEIRMAGISDNQCLPAAVNKVFNTVIDNNGNDQLYFKNQYGYCVVYYLDGARLRSTAGTVNGVISDFITPSKLEVRNLKFFVADDKIGAFHSQQPYVTIVMAVKAIGLAINEQKMKIQITVSSRYYE